MTRETALLLGVLGMAWGCSYWMGAPPTKPVAPSQWNRSPSDETNQPRSVDHPADGAKSISVPRGTSCTRDQILTMKKAGLSDSQVKAACPE